MRSNYSKIGPYIAKVETRNTEGSTQNLLGVSVTKNFIPSIANTVGTDFTTYRIVERDQFTYIPDTSRRGDKIGIAHLDFLDRGLVSQAYTVFEITNKERLNPEYLMMWFRRPEFDRYARFISHGSVREIFEWEDMCNVSLPIPSPAKQREVVEEYNVIQNRIKLNQQLIEKLEETAQTIYKRWFVDFEFPDDHGKPYKSNGGEMIESPTGPIPSGWEPKVIGDVVTCNTSTLTKQDSTKEIVYLDTSNITNNNIDLLQIIDVTNGDLPSRARRKIKHNDIIFSAVRPNLKHYGILKNPPSNMIVSTGFIVLSPKLKIPSELLFLNMTTESSLKNLQARAEMSVSTYPSITPDDLLQIPFILPEASVLLKGARILDSLFTIASQKREENRCLSTMSGVLLSKLATIEG